MTEKLMKWEKGRKSIEEMNALKKITLRIQRKESNSCLI